MRRVIAVFAVLGAVLACSDNIGPDPYARQHVVKTEAVACATTPVTYDLHVSWVDWSWQAIYLKGAQQVANVTDSSVTHSSGCVYSLGDNARVKLIPLGDIRKYLDSTFIDVKIQ